MTSFEVTTISGIGRPAGLAAREFGARALTSAQFSGGSEAISRAAPAIGTMPSVRRLPSSMRATSSVRSSPISGGAMVCMMSTRAGRAWCGRSRQSACRVPDPASPDALDGGGGIDERAVHVEQGARVEIRVPGAICIIPLLSLVRSVRRPPENPLFCRRGGKLKRVRRSAGWSKKKSAAPGSGGLWASAGNAGMITNGC